MFQLSMDEFAGAADAQTLRQALVSPNESSVEWAAAEYELLSAANTVSNSYADAAASVAEGLNPLLGAW